jgi:hypothetical protein
VRRTRNYILYVVFLLVLFEVSFRMLFAFRPGEFDETSSWRRQWILRHRWGAEIYYSFDRYDPTKGWAAKAGLRDVQVFKEKTLNTNSRGLRGRTEYSYEPTPGTLRIVVLGDSFTFGDWVSDDETYCANLEKILPHVEIINMGVHGYGHDQMLILFREEGVKYRPDIVLLGFAAADMSRNRLRFRDFAKPAFEIEGERLNLVGSPVPRPEVVLRWNWARPRTLDVVSTLAYLVRQKTGLEDARTARVTTRILDELVNGILGAGARPVFVYLPIDREDASSGPPGERERFFADWCARSGRVTCLSARPSFVAEAARNPDIVTRGHWKPAGHRVVAAAIAEGLIGNGLVAPRPDTPNGTHLDDESR